MLGGLSSVGASGGYFLVVVRGLLVTGASLVAAPGFRVHRLTSCGTQGLLALKHGGGGLPRIRDQVRDSYIGRWILYH